MRLTFAGGPTIDVTSTDFGASTWLLELVAPALGPDGGSAPDWRLELAASSSERAQMIDARPASARLVPAYAVGHRLVELMAWEREGRLLLDDAERGAALVLGDRAVTVVGDPSSKRWRFSVALVVYELVAATMREQWLELHAAAVVHEGRVHLIAGAKGAGKTTLSTALARAGTGVLSNDRSFVRPGEAVGLPTPVKLLPRTLDLIPELAGARPPRPYLWAMAELADAEPAAPNDAELVLSPAEVVRRLGAPIRAGAHPLGSILLPHVVPDVAGVECSTVAPEEAERWLLDNVYRGSAAERATTVFEDAGAGRPPVRFDIAAAVAARHPVRHVRLGVRALGEPEVLLSILDELG